MAGKNPHFYNDISQLIEGRVDQLLPRERYLSPNGEHLWFKSGAQPQGWRLDPAQWAGFEDTDHDDDYDFTNQAARFRQTYVGLELPEWNFRHYLSDELAFSLKEPRSGYRPYVKIDASNKVSSFSFFPENQQPNGWISGFCYSFWSGRRSRYPVSSFVSSEWRRYRWFGDPEQEYFRSDSSQNAFFPIGGEPEGWVEQHVYDEYIEKIRISKSKINKDIDIIANKISSIFKESKYEIDSSRKLIDIKNNVDYNLYRSELITSLVCSGMDQKDIWMVRSIFENDEEVQCDEGSHPVATEHVSNMLIEATRLHQSSIAELHSPHDNPLPRLRKALKLIDESALLAEDAASYGDSDALRKGLKELHQTQGQIKAMITQLEAQSSRPSYLPWFMLAIILLVLFGALGL